MTTAVYRLDRTNTRSTDPNDPTRIIQTGSQRTNGYELALNGSLTPAWTIAGGYAYQNAFVTSATVERGRGRAGRAGAASHTSRCWNNYRLHSEAVGRRSGLLYRSGRVRGGRQHRHAAGVHARRCGRVLFGSRPRRGCSSTSRTCSTRSYYLNADSNTNISPGSPAAVRVALTTRF